MNKYKLCIQNYGTWFVSGKTAYDATIRTLNTLGLRYAHTKFTVVEID